jgi:hypothetical protein
MRNIITKQLCSGTKYFNQSQKLAGQKGARKYWIERSEMLARAFEAFVQDSLISKGISCDGCGSFGTTRDLFKSVS